MTAIYKHIIQTLMAVVMLAFLNNVAQSDDSTSYLPSIPKAEAGTCVADPEVIRKNHMIFLKHDRDLRVQKGNSDIEYSLKECVACHVVRDDIGSPVSYESPQHFCRSCHDYVAVKIDCFSCHNSKPDGDAIQSLPNPHADKIAINKVMIERQNRVSDWLKDKADD